MIKIYTNINPISPFNESNKKIKNDTKMDYQSIDTKKNLNILYFLIFISLIIIAVIKWHYHTYYFNY